MSDQLIAASVGLHVGTCVAASARDSTAAKHAGIRVADKGLECKAEAAGEGG